LSLERLERIERILKAAKEKVKIPSDPVKFCTDILGFQPTKYQIKLLRDNSQFIAARWCRQSGKSFIVSAMLLHFALTHPGSYIMIVGPSFKASKRIIRRITPFLKKIPGWLRGKPRKIKLEFANGSMIEAHSNNPDTIRGETSHFVYWDEVNFTPDDEEMYDAIIFSLGTTRGRFLGTSTPWTADHIFYKMCTHPDFEDYSRHHVTWREALEPNGPLSAQILEKIKKQYASDPHRWRREMEAEWAEDEDVWLPQSLITACIDPDLEYYDESELVPNL
jgi:phage terminase large subunit-like protein